MSSSVEEKESIVALATALAAVRSSSESSFARAYESLDDVEQLLFKHKEVYGPHNVQFQQGLEEFVLLCNTAAIQQLQFAGKGSTALSRCGDLLTRAEQHTRRAGYLRSLPDQHHTTARGQLRLLCLNNLACYNKQIEKPLAAIGFLEEALGMQLRQLSHRQHDQHDQHDGDALHEAASPNSSCSAESAIALTHLNLCAVLSQMKRHDAAAEHARSAIDLLASGGTVDGSTLVVAHYNLAVELEHLGELPRAVAVVAKGLAVAHDHGLHRDDHDAVRLLEQMKRSTGKTTFTCTAKASKSPRGVVVSPRQQQQRQRPPSPRTLRQQTHHGY